MIWSGIATASAAISEQYHQHQPVFCKASDCRPRVPVNSSHGQLVTLSTRHTVDSSRGRLVTKRWSTRQKQKQANIKAIYTVVAVITLSSQSPPLLKNCCDSTASEVPVNSSQHGVSAAGQLIIRFWAVTS